MTSYGSDLGIDAMPDGVDPWLDVQPISHDLPLTGQEDTAPGKSVPDALDAILFDPPATDGPSRKTFALVDSATCPLLPEILETSGLDHKCLFTGKAKEDGSDAAPWLVELAPGHRLTRQLFSTTDWPGGLWEFQSGIILKTTLNLDELWAHCRKFTRIKDEARKWLFYRYWSAPVSTRVMALGNRPELLQFVSPFFPQCNIAFEVILLNNDMQARLSRMPETAPPTARPVLTDAAHHTIRLVRRAQQYETLIDIALKHATDQTDRQDNDIRTDLRLKRDWYFQVGFWQRDHIVKLLVWEVLLGPQFVDSYANGTVRAIITDAKAPFEAIMNIEFFLEAQEIRRAEAELTGETGSWP